MDVLAHWVEKIVAVADERDLFHTTEDGYDVGARFNEDDARAILDAIDYRGAVEALTELIDAAEHFITDESGDRAYNRFLAAMNDARHYSNRRAKRSAA